MITVLDTNILFDILSGPPPQAQIAQMALRIAGIRGKLLLPIICYAELAGYFRLQSDLDSFLTGSSIALLPLDEASSFLAGTFHKSYRQRGGTKLRVLADFIVAAQAQLNGDRLLTSDTRFFGTTFPALVSVKPEDLLP
jgi:predicted nucleic acid-binding protein